MATSYEKLIDKLKEIFQLDQADLDFGIYRIMNQKRDEITQFLESDLLPQVKAVFEKYQGGVGAEVKAELETLVRNVESAGMNPDLSPKVVELRQKLGTMVDDVKLEDEVYSDLYNFFRRYYDEGDFISLRRYKEGVYAIPYEGEEVKLHWANADQYYVKTAENFRDYAFRLPSGRRVHFKLVDASVEKDNNEATSGSVRRFVLSDDQSVSEVNGELVIPFEYKLVEKKDKQSEYSDTAVKAVLGNTNIAGWNVELRQKAPTDKDPNRTLLEKHLTQYTAKNTFDYFIHKDLGKFLRRELDFYIKNEVMHLDDIENDTAPRVEQYLSKIKTIRLIAHKIIAFLAQIENFQKKLWLKKKFILETTYLVTLDRIPDYIFPQIASNTAQREEWVRLFSINEIVNTPGSADYTVPLSIEFLKSNRQLILNTTHFPREVVERIESEALCGVTNPDGTLISSENFQALNLLGARYGKTIDSIYVDPPYNTDASEILYKNDYKNSSWLGLMEDRFRSAKQLLNTSSILCVTIDDAEQSLLKILMDTEFGAENSLGVACIRNNPQGRSTVKGFAINHEYALFYRNTSDATSIGRIQRTQEQIDRYNSEDKDGMFLWENLRKTGTGSNRADRPKQFYPIYSTSSGVRVPKMSWDQERRCWEVLHEPSLYESVFLPINEHGIEKVWKWGHERVIQNPTSIKVDVGQDGTQQLFRKNHINPAGALPGTWWDKPEYGAGSHGTNLLTAMFGVGHTFPFPKSVYAVATSIQVTGLSRDGLVLDFFAGSGTTGHAVTKLNRQDDGQRKYILVEMGSYFDGILVPRIAKAIYCDTWDGGKPAERFDGLSQTIKIVRLESYEDALNNLALKRSSQQQQALDMSPEAKEDYLLHYMIDVESRGSASLLDIKSFEDPFNYKLNIATGDAGESRPTVVDLVETFNYLIGLTVRHIDTIRGYRVIQGTSPKNEKVLVIWRNLKEKSNDDLDEFFQKQGYNTQDMEFDLVYVNGDNNLENLRRPDESWKVRLTEEYFQTLMFDVKDV